MLTFTEFYDHLVSGLGLWIELVIFPVIERSNSNPLDYLNDYSFGT
jgi:hypothetical protein